MKEQQERRKTYLRKVNQLNLALSANKCRLGLRNPNPDQALAVFNFFILMLFFILATVYVPPSFADQPRPKGSEKTLEYISLDQSKQLLQQFNMGKRPELEDLKGLELVCDMYGVQSRLQAEKDLRLYNFEIEPQPTKEKPVKLSNRGSQITKNYVFEATGLFGEKGSLRDELRKSESNRWISQLSFRRDHEAEPKIIALSLCRRPQLENKAPNNKEARL